MSDLQLLLADEDGPALGQGLPATALEGAPQPAGARKVTYLWSEDGTNDLRLQRWAVIYPRDRPELLDAVAPLIALREQQQGAEAMRLALDPLDDGQALYRQLYDGGLPLAQQPRYLLILGDLDEVSSEAQRRLGATGAVGRLALDRADDYRAYAQKAVSWEGATVTSAPRLLLYGAFDAYDGAMRAGEDDLLAPVEAAAAAGELGALAGHRSFGRREQSPTDGARALLEGAAEDVPSVLLSVTHGLGSARWSADERRRRQGAMRIAAGLNLEAEQLRDRAFLPGGLWAFFACFGAGTPSESRYQTWLNELARTGVFPQATNVLGTLSTDRPFVSALAKAALANPRGPLGVLGHIDLAWGWSFRDEEAGGVSRARRFANLLASAAAGDRLGLGLGPIGRAARGAGHKLVEYAEHQQRGALRPDELRSRGHDWMTWHDLGAWVLLGDPAARLALPQRQALSFESLLGLPLSSPAPSKPAADLDTLVTLVLAKLAGEPDARVRAETAGLSWTELRRLEQAFVAAGRGEIARIQKI